MGVSSGEVVLCLRDLGSAMPLAALRCLCWRLDGGGAAGLGSTVVCALLRGCSSRVLAPALLGVFSAR